MRTLYKKILGKIDYLNRAIYFFYWKSDGKQNSIENPDVYLNAFLNKYQDILDKRVKVALKNNHEEFAISKFKNIYKDSGGNKTNFEMISNNDMTLKDL